MATFKNYNVSALPDYVDQTREELIAKSVLGAKSIDLFNLFTGVKGATALNLIDTKVTFGNGAECGWDETGDVNLSQRILDPAYLKVNLSICDKNLLGKWTEHLVKIAANKVDSDLPFEKELIDGIIADINTQVEKMIYQGTKSDTSFEGLLGILQTASAPTASGATAYEAIKAAIKQLPANVFAKDDVTVLVGNDTYAAFMQELVEANLYHYNPANGADGFYVPGTPVKVVAVPGLVGTNKIIVASLSNIYYGTDLTGDKETIDAWFSRDTRSFRIAVEFLAGVQVAYPEEVVVATVG